MIEHVCRRAAAARGVDGVVVATDDSRIATAVEAFGGTAQMTDPRHRTGTDRVAEVARALPCEFVINVQGDEPLIRAEMIVQVLEPLVRDGVRMSTLRRVIEDPAEYTNPNVVKVVVDRQGDAMYFSRSPIPFVRDGDGTRPGEPGGGGPACKHVGIYGYRRDFLLELCDLPRTPLEIAESLEQLRALEHGYRIRTVETEYDSIGVDTPEDLARVRATLQGLTAARA